MDYAFRILQSMGAPPVFSKPVMEQLADRPPIPPAAIFPEPFFTRAITNNHGRRFPQAIAHRGYKAQFPENTMGAFIGAFEVGAHALETDVHLTRDGVVVLSHDATLKRCFGVDERILDCDWTYISHMRTIQEPRQAMPTLEELLRYLAEPDHKRLWLLLDIKLDNNAEDIMRLMSKTVQRVPPMNGTRWENRIILGCWAAKYIPLCHDYFPGFPITNIGFSIPYARQIFAVPNISFNMLQVTLVSPFGQKFIRDAKARNRQIYSWTVNDEKNMDWCIRKNLDGVVTDDPKKYLEVCARFNEASTPPPWPTIVLVHFLRINIFTWIFGLLFWLKHGFGLDDVYLSEKKR